MLFDTYVNDQKKTFISSTVAVVESMGVGFDKGSKDALCLSITTGSLIHRLTFDRNEIDKILEIAKSFGGD